MLGQDLMLMSNQGIRIIGTSVLQEPEDLSELTDIEKTILYSL